MKKIHDKPLTLEQLEDASDKILLNARQLYDDAIILYNNKSNARALFLLRIANEELGKFIIINNVLTQKINKLEIDWKSLWTRFYRHTEKSLSNEKYFKIYSTLYAKDISAPEMQSVVNFYEFLKFSSLYVDINGDEFVLPNNFIEPELVKVLLNELKIRLDYYLDYTSSQFTEYIEKARGENNI